MRGLASLLLPLLLVARTAPGDELPVPRRAQTRYAAFPLRNLTADPDAARELGALLRTALSARGAELVPAGELDGILQARRIRYTDSVGTETARAIAEGTGATHILLGTLLDHRRGPRPLASISLRVFDARDGRRARSALVSLRGEDFAGLLGLGAITESEDLAAEVLARLLAHFDASGAPLPAGRGPGTPPGAHPPAARSTFVREGFDAGALERIAILPLANRSRCPEASALFSEILAHVWFRSSGLQVVEQAELLAALVRERVRSMDDLGPERLRRIGSAVGTRHFVLGSVDRFADEVFVGSERYPEVEASLRILDAESGLIMAAAGLRRRGDEYHEILGFGRIHDAVTLAARVAGELIAAVEE